jgi:hypothetical protein
VRRIAVAAALVAVLLTGVAESFDAGNGISPPVATSSMASIPGAAKYGGSAAQTNSSPVAAANESAQVGENAQAIDHLQSSDISGVRMAARHSSYPANLANEQTAPTNNEPMGDNDIANNIALIPIPREDAIERIIPIAVPIHATLSDLAATDVPDRFEIGFDASGPGVTLPSSGFNLNRFASEARVAYNVDENDQVALHIGNEYYQWLSVTPTNGNGFTSLVGSMEPKQFASYELFYDRMQPLADGRLLVSLGVGGGLYSVGSLISAELGFKAPLSDRVMAGITFSVTRAHQNGPSEQEVLSSQSLPAIYSGADIHNTLNGVIQYGLSYRF